MGKRLQKRVVRGSTAPAVWDDKIDYYFDGKVLARRKCGGKYCRKTTQLELCKNHLLAKGLEVKSSNIAGSGWGLFTTKDRSKDEDIATFTGVVMLESALESFDYATSKAGGMAIDSSIERCSAACANSDGLNNNCCLVKYRRTYIKTTRSIKSGDEIFVPYGVTYC